MPNFMRWIPSWLNVPHTVEAAERNNPTTSARLSPNSKSQDFNNQAMIATIINAVPPQGREAALRNIPLIMKALKDEGILTPNILAYTLATIQHETAGTFRPIEEIQGRQQARKYGYSGGGKFFGRGFIQLTHDYNYRKYGERIGIGNELVKNPDLALDPAISAKILAAYMKDSGTAEIARNGDFYNARRRVNSLDYKTYQPIADLAAAYRGNISPNIGDFDSVDLNLPSSNKSSLDYGETIKRMLAPPVEASTSQMSPVSSSERRGSQNQSYDYSAMSKIPNYSPAKPLSFNEDYSPPDNMSRLGISKPISYQYTVKPGDTLWGISQQLTGKGQDWKNIQGYAGKPTEMPVGTRLTVPSSIASSSFQPSVSSSRPSQNQSYQSPIRPTPVPTPIPPKSAPSQSSYPAPSRPSVPKSAPKQVVTNAISSLFGKKK